MKSCVNEKRNGSRCARACVCVCVGGGAIFEVIHGCSASLSGVRAIQWDVHDGFVVRRTTSFVVEVDLDFAAGTSDNRLLRWVPRCRYPRLPPLVFSTRSRNVSSSSVPLHFARSCLTHTCHKPTKKIWRSAQYVKNRFCVPTQPIGRSHLYSHTSTRGTRAYRDSL